MNVNPATASMEQQYSNNLQATATQIRVPEQTVEVQPKSAVPEEPSKEARPVESVNETSVGRNVDVYI